MNANDISNMLYSILVFLGAVFGALNLHQYLKHRKTHNDCKRLIEENKKLKLQLEKHNDGGTE